MKRAIQILIGLLLLYAAYQMYIGWEYRQNLRTIEEQDNPEFERLRERDKQQEKRDNEFIEENTR